MLWSTYYCSWNWVQLLFLKNLKQLQHCTHKYTYTGEALPSIPLSFSFCYWFMARFRSNFAWQVHISCICWQSAAYHCLNTVSVCSIVCQWPTHDPKLGFSHHPTYGILGSGYNLRYTNFISVIYWIEWKRFISIFL